MNKLKEVTRKIINCIVFITNFISNQSSYNICGDKTMSQKASNIYIRANNFKAFIC